MKRLGLLLAILSALGVSACGKYSPPHPKAVCGPQGVERVQIKSQGRSAAIITCNNGNVFVWTQ